MNWLVLQFIVRVAEFVLFILLLFLNLNSFGCPDSKDAWTCFQFSRSSLMVLCSRPFFPSGRSLKAKLWKTAHMLLPRLLCSAFSTSDPSSYWLSADDPAVKPQALYMDTLAGETRSGWNCTLQRSTQQKFRDWSWVAVDIINDFSFSVQEKQPPPPVATADQH